MAPHKSRVRLCCGVSKKGVSKCVTLLEKRRKKMKKGVEMSQIIFKEMLDRCVALLEKRCRDTSPACVSAAVPRASLLRCVEMCCTFGKKVKRDEKRCRNAARDF